MEDDAHGGDVFAGRESEATSDGEVVGKTLISPPFDRVLRVLLGWRRAFLPTSHKCLRITPDVDVRMRS